MIIELIITIERDIIKVDIKTTIKDLTIIMMALLASNIEMMNLNNQLLKERVDSINI